MAQLYLKGVYYDTESGGLWFINNAGSYEEIAVNGGWGTSGTIATLTGDGTVDLNGHEISFDWLGNQLLYVDPEVGNEISSMRAVNATGGTNVGYVFLKTQNDLGQAELQATFNGAAKIADILLTANAGGSSIVYTAELHSFSSAVNINGHISTNNGANSWNLGAASGGAPTPDSSILVTIDGTTYAIAALANP